MKDFDDFAQLVDRTTDQDMARIFANVIEQMNLPKDANGNVSFSVEDLMPFSTAVSNARTMALLRKYHEWANAEERELLYQASTVRGKASFDSRCYRPRICLWS